MEKVERYRSKDYRLHHNERDAHVANAVYDIERLFDEYYFLWSHAHDERHTGIRAAAVAIFFQRKKLLKLLKDLEKVDLPQEASKPESYDEKQSALHIYRGGVRD